MNNQWTVTIEEPLMVCLMGDPQFEQDLLADQAIYAADAVDDLAELDPSALFILGDLAQADVEDWQANWAAYQTHLAGPLEALQLPFHGIAGNSDLRIDEIAMDNIFEQETGFPLFDVVEYRGIRFILISTRTLSGDGDHVCGMDSLLGDLTEELAADTETTTVIFFHAPVSETTFGSAEAQMHHLLESAEVRDRMHAHPNVAVYANGHIHTEFTAIDSNGRGHYAFQDGVLHLRVAATAQNNGSACLYVFHDQIVSKVRNHEYSFWRPTLEVGIVLPTTLEPITPGS